MAANNFSTTYLQDFNSFTATTLTPTNAATTTMSEVSSQAGGGTVSGWYFYGVGGARWGRTNGGSNTGSFFVMYDSATTPEKALGSLGSGSSNGFFGSVFKNTSGSTINAVTISYDAVINRNPSTTANPFPLTYLVSNTDVVTTSGTGAGTFNNSAGTWNPTTLGFSTPSSGTGAPGTQAVISPLFKIGGSSITGDLTGLNWQDGEYLYLRWSETDNAGADATAGVDNFSIIIKTPSLASLMIAATNANQSEGNSGNTAFTFTVTRSGDTTGASSVNYEITGSGTNVANATDFGGTLPSGTVSFAANETSKVITVNVSGDTTVESDETFTVTLSSPSGATISTATATGTIINDDASPTPTVTLSVSTNAGTEAGSTLITVIATASSPVTGDQTVNLGVSGTGITTGDYTLSNNVITIANGQTEGTVTFTVADDTVFEGLETAVLTISNPTSGITLGTTTQNISITDNDPSPFISEVHPSGNGNTNGYNGDWFEVTNLGSSAVDITGWRIDDNSNSFAASVALNGVTSIAAGQSVIFIEGDASKVTAFNTAWFGGNAPSGFVIGTYSGNGIGLGNGGDAVNLYNASGTLITNVTFGAQSTAASTFDNRSALATVSAFSAVGTNGASISFNGAETGSPGTIVNSALPAIAIAATDATAAETNLDIGKFRIARTGSTTNALIVNYTVATGAGQATSADYNETLTGTATIAAGQSFVDITITPIDDPLVEGNETITLTLTANAAYTINNDTATVTIADNDTVNNPPTIALNTTSTTNFLDGGAASSPTSGNLYISGVIGDPTDPASTSGLVFTVSDAETSATSLTVTASSNNTAVVSNANLVRSGTGADRTLKITPTGVGIAVITVNVNDGTNNTTYTINYAASAASSNPTTTRFLTGTSDASSAIAIDADYMLVADDEDQIIRLYDRNDSGLPLNSFDFINSLGLSGTSEVDIEASTKIGDTIYWIGSHSNNSSGDDRPNRERIFSTTILGTGASTTLTFGGYYQFFEDDAIAWDNTNGHGLGAGFLGLAASAANNVVPEQSNGFNIEGFTVAPNGTTGYIAFRAPNEPTTDRTKALIVPVTNFTSILNGSGGTAGSAIFGTPIQLDLGGRGIRSIERNASNEYLIIAGPAGAATGTAPNDFRLYTWTGVATDAPVLRSADLTALNAGGSFETIVEVPNSLTSSTQLQFLVDNGDSDWYSNGTISKDLAQTNFQKFRSELINLGTAILPTKISEIQGTGTAAIAGTYTIEGIVVGDFQGANQLGGFYLQEEDTDADGNVLTSEAIFVISSTAVNVGDKVRLTGTVVENSSTPSFNQAVITPTSVSVLATGQQALVTATILDLPTASFGDLERYEGMLVTIPETLTVTEVFNLGRFGEVSLSANGRLPNPTNIVDPNDNPASGTSSTGTSNVTAVTAQQNLNNRSRIILDDGSSASNLSDVPYVNTTDGDLTNDTLRIGSTIAGLTGVVGFGFNNYRIQATQTPVFNYEARPTLPTVGGSLKVSTFNVLNYFNGDGLGGGFPTSRGADSAAEFSRQRAKIIAAIQSLNADVVGLVEIENDGDGANSAIADLVNGLNAAMGTGTYVFVPLANTTGSPGTDAIKVAFIYKPSAVSLVGNAVYFNDSAFDTARPPLAQTFSANSTGEKFTAIVNHFKSKGSSAGLSGDADQVDGQGLSNATRKAQSTALLNFVSQMQTASGDNDVMILGDLNAYNEEDPIDILRAGGFTKLTTATDSYVFDGQTGSLDHALVSASLVSQVTGAAKWNINSSEPIAFDYNNNVADSGEANTELRNDTSLYSATPFRSSDHDPVLVGLNLYSAIAPTNLSLSATSINENVAVNNVNNVIGTFSTTDPNVNDTFTYSFVNGVNDNAAFSINGSQLLINASPNFEAKSSYNILVRTTDNSGLSFDKSLIININDVNEAPSGLTLKRIGVINAPLQESQEVATIPVVDTAATGQFNATLNGNTLTVQGSFSNLTSALRDTCASGVDSEGNPIDSIHIHSAAAGTNGGIIRALTVTADANQLGGTFNGVFTLSDSQVTLAKNNGLYVNIHTLNNPGGELRGQIILDTVPIAENTTAVTTVSAIDPEGNALTYSLSGGADRTLFAINPTTGALSFVTAPNFEAPADAGTNNIYNVQVQVSDGTTPVIRDLTVTVTNVIAPDSTNYDFTNLPSLGITSTGQNILLGGFSGLFFQGTNATNGNLKFTTLTDRGPNGEPNGQNRPFALPAFQPEVVSFELNRSTNAIAITKRTGLFRADGTTKLTGLPNLQAGANGIAYTDEIGVDLVVPIPNVLTNDPFGIDSEGIVITENGNYWIVDEYRPAIYEFDANGKMLNRFIPRGTATAPATLTGGTDINFAAGTFGTEVLPEVYAQRRPNRGFEAVALEGNKLYAFIQSAIDHPDVANNATSSTSRNLRILEFDIVTKAVTGEYLYLLDSISASGLFKTDKIGDAVSLGNKKFAVVERDDVFNSDSNKLIYQIDLANATNINNTANFTLPSGKTIEQLTESELTAAGIKVVTKNLIANAAKSGYTGVDKLEGLALVDSNTLALINDNDFNVAGTTTPARLGLLSLPNALPVTLKKFQKNDSDIFSVGSGSNPRPSLSFTVNSNGASQVGEVGVFIVDDADGKIDGLAPNAAGYAEKALARAKVIFSSLGNNPDGFTANGLSRLLEFNDSDKFRFYVINDRSTTTSSALTNKSFDKVTFSPATILNFRETSGVNTITFNGLDITIAPSDAALPIGTALQDKTEGEVFDLTQGFDTTAFSQVKAEFTVNREAAFNNFVGFYKIENAKGDIKKSDGTTVKVGESGYVQAAIAGQISGIDLSVSNQSTQTSSGMFKAGSIFAPFIVVNGNPSAILDSNPNNDPAVYFPFLGANTDKVDHIRLLANNTFGFEDLPSGGDFDYNDIIVRVKLTPVA